MARCYADGCDKTVNDALLMCLPHWRRVPKELQTKVYETYRNFVTDPDAYYLARNEARDALKAKVRRYHGESV